MALPADCAHSLLHQPRIAQALRGGTDAILLSMCVGLRGECEVDDQTLGVGVHGPAGPAAVLRAANALAKSLPAMGNSSQLLCGSPGRIVDLFLLLHHTHRIFQWSGTSAAGSRANVLGCLELLVGVKNRHSLLPKLDTSCDLHELPDSVIKHFNLPAVTRLLQHCTLSVLPVSAEMVTGGPVQRATAAVFAVRCCAVLRHIFDAAQLSNQSAAGGKEAHLQLIYTQASALITALLPLAFVPARPPVRASSSLPLAASPIANEVQALMHRVKNCLPAEYWPQLLLIPPIPPFVSFADELAAVRFRSWHSKSLTSALASFGARLAEPDVGGGSLRARLVDLRARLTAARASAEGSGHSDGVGDCWDGIEGHGAVAKAAAASAGKLLQLCRVEADDDRRLLLAECLALLSAAGLATCALTSNTVGIDSVKTSFSCDRDMGEIIIHDSLRRCLLLLHRFLTNDDETVMLLAAIALQQLHAATPSPPINLPAILASIVKSLPIAVKEIQAYKSALCPPLPSVSGFSHHARASTAAGKAAFGAVVAARAEVEASVPRLRATPTAALRGKSNPKDGASCRATQLARPDVASLQLWSTAGKTVRAWVCGLVHALLENAAEPLLRPLRFLAAYRPQLSRVLLLPALLDALGQDKLGAPRGNVASRLARTLCAVFDEVLCIAPPPDACQLASAGMIMPVIIALRARSMHSRHGRVAKERGFEVLPWVDSFWRALDLKKAAAAAHTAGAPISAIQLIEISAEVECELVPSAVFSSSADASGLLEVIANLPAPDCARGIPTTACAGADSATSLRLLSLCGEHASGLGLLDTQHQGFGGRDSGGAPELCGGGGSEDGGAEGTLRLARSLRSIGCDQLCELALRTRCSVGAGAAFSRAGTGAPGLDSKCGNAAVHGALREARAESAWRLGLWRATESAAEWSTAPPSRGCRFHEQLHASLVAMCRGQTDAAQAMLRDCTLDLVGRLGGAGDEGGKRAIEQVISIRMALDARKLATRGAAIAAAVIAMAGVGPAALSKRHRKLLASASGEFEVIEHVLAFHGSLLEVAPRLMCLTCLMC